MQVLKNTLIVVATLVGLFFALSVIKMTLEIEQAERTRQDARQEQEHAAHLPVEITAERGRRLGCYSYPPSARAGLSPAYVDLCKPYWGTR
jgi:hypothetical protein